MRRELMLSTVTFVLGMSIGALATAQWQSEPDGAPEAIAAPAQASHEVADQASRARLPAPESVSADAEKPAAPLDLTSVERQLATMDANWESVQSELGQLWQRVAALEKGGRGTGASAADGVQRLPARTPEQRHQALLASGLMKGTAADILQWESELDILRLELKDQATREGWYRDSAYFDALRELNSEQVNLRGEVGDEIYDRYLFLTGQANRVTVDSVMIASAAEQSGLQAGDVIEVSVGSQIFNIADLTRATTAGVRDEMIAVTLRRNGAVFEIWVPRGPLGVRLDRAQISPDGN